jgi:two-component system, response regulator, stage 0 sporulation protein F
MKTVLFVDDDEGFRVLCKRIFEDEGYHVVLAQDGIEAIGIVENQKPDVAILDVRMPRQNGFDVAEEINAINPRIPIIFYTSYDDICTVDHRARFAAACVGKSSDFTELALAVSRVLTPDSRGEIFRFGLPRRPAAASQLPSSAQVVETTADRGT